MLLTDEQALHIASRLREDFSLVAPDSATIAVSLQRAAQELPYRNRVNHVEITPDKLLYINGVNIAKVRSVTTGLYPNELRTFTFEIEAATVKGFDNG